MMPVIVVPGTGVLATVVKLSLIELPGVPTSAASSSAPPATAVISCPITCSVTIDDPGHVPVGNSHAPVPSV